MENGIQGVDPILVNISLYSWCWIHILISSPKNRFENTFVDARIWIAIEIYYAATLCLFRNHFQQPFEIFLRQKYILNQRQYKQLSPPPFLNQISMFAVCR